MHAIGYVRVSTSEQASEGMSLAAQEERIRGYAAMAGLTLVEVIREEGVSGAIPLAERPGGAALLRALRAKQATQIITLKLDRLFRDASDCLAMTKVWDKAGVSLHLIDMGGQAINTASAMGRMFLTMAAGFAELERNLTRERTAAAKAHKKRHKQAYSPVPFGYSREGNTLVELPAEQATLSTMQAWRRTGWSLRAIARELNARRIPTKTGATWYASTVRGVLANTIHHGAA